MSVPHAASGEVVNLSTIMASAEAHHSRALIKSDRFETMVVQMAKGQTMDEHSVPGPVTIQGLVGTVRFTVDGQKKDLAAQDWMHLNGGVKHSVEALEDCAFLLTIIFV